MYIRIKIEIVWTVLVEPGKYLINIELKMFAKFVVVETVYFSLHFSIYNPIWYVNMCEFVETEAIPKLIAFIFEAL